MCTLLFSSSFAPSLLQFACFSRLDSFEGESDSDGSSGERRSATKRDIPSALLGGEQQHTSLT